MQQKGVKRSSQTQAEVTHGRTNELIVEQTAGAVNGGAAVVQRGQTRTSLATSPSQSIVIQREHGGRVFTDTAAVTPAVTHLPKKRKSRLIDKPEKGIRQQRTAEVAILQRYVRLQESGNILEATAFVTEYDSSLKQCKMPDIFNNVAASFVKNAKPDEAVRIYRTLLSCPGNEDAQLGILYALKPLLPQRELLKLAEQKRSTASPEQLKKLDIFAVELLYGILDAEPEQVEETAQTVLEISPTDQIARAALGWWYYNRQRFEEAYDCFRQLNSGTSRKTEHVEGYIYVLIKLGRLDEALTVARLNQSDQKIAAMTKDVMLMILWNRVTALPPDSPEIETTAQSILLIRPDDEAIRVVRAWWYYNRQEFLKAYEEFNALYIRNPGGKGYSYALASSLAQLKRYDEAAGIASKNKLLDERLASLETDIYREQAKLAYAEKRYREAALYFGKVLEADPDDQETKDLLESSRYRQTLTAKVLSPIVGLSGYSYGSLFHDLHGPYGTGVSALVNQGIDWVKLPWDVLLRTYGELWYRTRSEDATYYDLAGHALGMELKKSDFRLGAEYVSEQYSRQDKSDAGVKLFLSWYYDWYKYTYDRSEDAGWLNIHSFSGSTYGKVSQDLGGSTGTTVSGSINQGIDWAVLPGNIMLNSFLEYRCSFRTRDNVYYNEHGPAVGTELQKAPFRLGIEYYLEHDTERNELIPRTTVYLKYYFGWDLKPNK